VSTVISETGKSLLMTI